MRATSLTQPEDTPSLLLMAEYNGTLAAARCLAKQGAPVVLATTNLLAPARWSNAVSKVVSCPAITAGPAALVDWLLTYGQNNPKAVLYPTCDEMAWLLAHHRDSLSQYFYMYSPDGAVLRTILDKRELYRLANAAGIATPRTWCPTSEQELESVFAEVNVCIVKPRTQAFFKSQWKGGIARSAEQLRQIWNNYRHAQFATQMAADIPDLHFPLIQEYLPGAAEHVYSVSGFINRSGRLLASRASCKVLQTPPGAGIGICFEDIANDQATLQSIVQMCARIGYYGVFEAEFIRRGERNLLIDFNPRYFGQMQFDIARGMPLPWLVQRCALDDEAVIESKAIANTTMQRAPKYFVDSIALAWYLRFGALFRFVSAAESMKWRTWLDTHARHIADAVVSQTDVKPGIAASVAKVWRAVRYPRAFWRSFQNPIWVQLLAVTLSLG